MIVDLAQTVPSPRGIEADICIVGGGPAGITLALELARQRPSLHIVLAEAGGQGNETNRDRDIFHVELGEKSYDVLAISRRRKLGGTTAHWGGWCMPLDDIDFMDNPRWDLPSWPLSKMAVDAYIPRAAQWVELENTSFSFADIRSRYTNNLLPIDDGQSEIDEQIIRFSPATRFGERYIKELRDQDNLTCLLHANCHAIERKNDKVTFAKVKPLDGDSLRISATSFVLAMGGMETTRLLLNLRGDNPADGTGLHSPLLGKCFADHFRLSPGIVLAPAELRYSPIVDPSGAFMPRITFSKRALKNGEHNSCLRLNPISAPDSLLYGYGGIATGLVSTKLVHYRANVMIEPRPNVQSKLSLLDDHCELGLRRLHLEWRPMPEDYKSAYRLLQNLGNYLGTTGRGRHRPLELSTSQIAATNGDCHHMGTTRMAQDSIHGVVDANLRVFDMDNLYVASSSVFPRYGYANPTLTIVALAIRLSEHLTSLYSSTIPKEG